MTLISTLNILEYKTKMMGKKDGAYPKSIGLQSSDIDVSMFNIHRLEQIFEKRH